MDNYRIVAVFGSAALAAALCACSSAAAPAKPPASEATDSLSQVGLACTVNMDPESLTIDATNAGPAVHAFLRSVQVGGWEGLSGNYAGPDTVIVGKWITLRPHQAETYGPFPLSDPALENVGAVGGICLRPS